MKKNYTSIFLFFFLLGLNSIYSQVGIGTTTPNGALDINSSTNGVLVSNVALTSRNVAAPVVNPNGGALLAGTLVWNTATAGTSPNNVSPGFYYWDGSIWVAIAGSGGKNWSLVGNSGTTAGTNYLGTNDTQNLQLRTNSTERLTIDGSNGNVAIGTSTVPSNIKLEVSAGSSSGIFGHSNNVGGYLGRESSISIGVPTQTISGSGVYANNPLAGYTSVFAQSTGAATVAANINYSDVWMASYNYVQNASSTYNPSANYNQLNVTNSGLAGTQIALRGYNSRGTTSGNPGYTVGVQGIADSQNQDSFGVQGLTYTNSTTRAGGYFEALNYSGTSQAYAYVGTSFGGTNRKITGTASVSEIIPTENHGRVTLTCPESPEYWYQDYGTVEMINGKATIILDDILADVIVVDEDNPIRVVCTPIKMPYFNGVTIMNQTRNSVEILELNGGTHSGKLQYQLVVKPKTNFGEGRFPQAPGPAYLKSDKEPIAAKAKNQPNDGRKIFRWPSDSEVYKYNPEDFTPIGDVIPAGPNKGKIKLGNGKYSDGTTVEKPKF